MRKYMIVAMVAILATGCAQDEQTPSEDEVEEVNAVQHENTPLKPSAMAEIINVNQDVIGEANFYQDSQGKTVVHTKVEGLEPAGFHGFHIHEKGICEANGADGPFTTAGGHYSPEDVSHDHHAGDMPSLYVNEDGTAQATFMMDRFGAEELIDANVSVMIHEGADNFANIPDRYQSSESDAPGADEETKKAGDAGDRIGCGVVVVPE
ncbi:superoxide dismutase family protein [Geomicrobium sp. JCM 19039]|uniref:superoxide dismutase family protein n=1 Tax=Geomicrobium sp. JCM 19039 TaxID=1460636 RepID=UPI0006941F45|nr:superoxide dismutase family protein [Geomicrobium sp. JCM 19039]